MPINFDEIQDYDSWLESNPEFAPPATKQLQEEELGFWGTVGDIGMGVVRGVSGAVENTLEIGQIFGLDYDLYDTDDVFGESETMAGSAAEGITQFLTGFLPGINIVSKAGKIAKVAKVADKFSKTTRTVTKVAAASAAADFTVFDAHEARLSDLIQMVPGLQNPVTEFLASDENDTEIEGRLKNAVEGLGIGVAFDGLLIALKSMRKGVKHLPDKEAASKATQEETERLVREGRDNVAYDIDPTQAPKESGSLPASEELDRFFEVPETPKKISTQSDDYPVNRGVDEMKNRINREASQGDLSNEEAQFANNLIDRMSQQGGLENTGVRFRTNKNLGGENVAGQYDWARNIISVAIEAVRGGRFNRTFTHEIWHAIDRTGIIDPAHKAAMQRDLTKARRSFAKRHGVNHEEMFKGKTGEATDQFWKFVKDNDIDKDEFYRLVDEEEWLAENMADATLKRLDLEGDTKSLIGFMRFTIQNVLTEIKSVFGRGTYDKVARDFLDGRYASPKAIKMLDASTISRMSRPVAYDIDPAKAAKNIEDLESGEEMLAAMRGLSKEELDQIAKDKSLNWRTLSDDQDVVKTLRIIGARSVALKEKAAEKVPEEVFLRQTTEATEAMQNAGILAPGDITKVDDVVQLAQQKSEDVRRASMFRHYMKEELDNLGGEVLPIADVVAKSGDRDKAVEFLLFKRGLERLEFAYKSVSSEFGRGLQAHQVPSGKMPLEVDRRNLEDILDDQVARDNLIESAGGIEKIRAEAQKFVDAATNGNIHKGLGQIKKKATWGGSLIEAWLNSILSGPTTIAVNALSGLLTTGMAPVEKALGAAARGDLKRAGRELKRYVYLARAAQDSIRLAHAVLKDNRAVLDPLTSSVREGQYGPSQITNRLLETRMANSTAGVEAARWIGTIFNLPSRFLTAGDELFKQLNYRSAMEAGLVEQAIKNGMTDSKEIASYATEQMQRLIQDGQYLARKQFTKEARNNPAIKNITDPYEKAEAIGKYVETEMKKYSPLAERALKQSQEVTFTDPLTKDRGHFINISRNLSNAVNESPGLRLFFPFVRTPSNIIKYVMDRTPLALLNKQTRDSFNIFNKELFSANAQIREDAVGRMMFGTSLMTTGYMLALNGNLTGGGPSDRNQQKVLRDAGWQPYSIRIGDKYVSYRRMDPFSSFFGLMADIADAYQNADPVTREDVEGVGMALLMSVAKNLSDKTYLTGMTRLSNALSNPDKSAESMWNSTVASFVPFGGLMQQVNRSLEDEIKDVRGVLDGVAQKIPGWSDSVAPRRNMLGEPLKYQRAGIPVLDSISPFDYSETTSDPLKREFAQIGHGFSPPRHVKNGVDLKEFESRSGQTAYDRWLELHGSVRIGGRSLRSALTRLIKSRAYKNLPYEAVEDLDKSPRVAAINRVVAKYRAKAFSQMLREYPEVKRRDEIGLMIKTYRRSGRTSEANRLLAFIEDTR